MLRTADLLASFRDFIAALRRSGFPWRRPLATEVAWPLLGRVILPLVDHGLPGRTQMSVIRAYECRKRECATVRVVFRIWWTQPYTTRTPPYSADGPSGSIEATTCPMTERWRPCANSWQSVARSPLLHPGLRQGRVHRKGRSDAGSAASGPLPLRPVSIDEATMPRGTFVALPNARGPQRGLCIAVGSARANGTHPRQTVTDL